MDETVYVNLWWPLVPFNTCPLTAGHASTTSRICQFVLPLFIMFLDALTHIYLGLRKSKDEDKAKKKKKKILLEVG